MSAPAHIVMRRAAALAAAREAGQPERLCIYCGDPAYVLACCKHWDLVRLDPFFTTDKAEPIEDVFPDVLLDRLQTQGA